MASTPNVSGLTAEQLAHVVGVQGNVWTEHVRTEPRAEWMTWPRAAAVAELGWSAPEHRDYADFRSRLRRCEAVVPTRWACVTRPTRSSFRPPVSPVVRRSQELRDSARTSWC